MMLAKSLQSAAGNAAAEANYIEDVFSTYLYTGNGSTQTINNGIDLAGEGGLVWIKGRSIPLSHYLWDTARGPLYSLNSNETNPSLLEATGVSAFNSNGFTTTGLGGTNNNGSTYVSWTFRKQPKFFDVVTYTGNGSNRSVAHNLGSAPGCVIVKCTSTTGQWATWHRSGTQLNNYCAYLNTTQGYADAASGIWGTNGGVPSMTSTTFSLGTDSDVNTNGVTYVAYLFAHNAGGFGLTGADNVISCGSFTTGASGITTVDLGYEPQYLLFKVSSTTGSWVVLDNMRGFSMTQNNILSPNTSAAEDAWGNGYVKPTATGFTADSSWIGTSRTYIYIAIRRGPMKVPESGTSVFAPLTLNPSSGTRTTNFPVDLQIVSTTASGSDKYVLDRLRGVATTTSATSTPAVFANLNNVESFSTTYTNNWSNTGYSDPSMLTGYPQVNWNFRRAPGFFDEVCYTGTGSARTVAHNLGVAPELMIVKRRSASTDSWQVYSGSATEYLVLNSTAAKVTGNSDRWNSTAPTSSVFSVGGNRTVNANTATYVAYLFASCLGVSKVGSYTGTGTTQVINCGFTAGSRFVLIKRTDSTGDWYVWDSARGIVAGNDPYLLLNTVDPQVTNTDFVDTAATGFEISSTAPAAINASGGTFVFLAIA